MIRKFILPERFYFNSGFYKKLIYGNPDKRQPLLVEVSEYLTQEHINWVSIRQGSVPFCFYVEIDVSDDDSIDKRFIPVEKSPYENQSDFDYTAEKYSQEILNIK